MQTSLLYKNTSIGYAVYGSGSAVVLLHGFLENSSMWEAVIPDLSRRHKVITIDLLGHGKTGCLGYVHSMELMAEAVAAVLTHLRIRRTTFIGHSMGGYVALAYADRYPDQTKGLVLMNATARADSPDRKQLRKRAIETAKTNYRNLVKMSISNLFLPEDRRRLAKEIEAAKAVALTTPLQGYIAAQEGMKNREDREVLLHFSPYKKMMIIGEKDPVLDAQNLLEQVDQADVNTVVFPNGHMSHIENTQELIQALQLFLKA